MAVKGQILMCRTTSRVSFRYGYEVFQFLPPITDTKIKTVIAITDYTLLQPSDVKLVVNTYNARLEKW